MTSGSFPPPPGRPPVRAPAFGSAVWKHRTLVWHLIPDVLARQSAFSHLGSFHYVFVPCNKVDFLSLRMSIKIPRK